MVPKPSAIRASDCVEAPVPPLLMPSVPAIVMTPESVTGPPEKVRPLTVLDTSILVTVPLKPSVALTLKLGYVPVTEISPPPVMTTV